MYDDRRDLLLDSGRQARRLNTVSFLYVGSYESCVGTAAGFSSENARPHRQPSPLLDNRI